MENMEGRTNIVAIRLTNEPKNTKGMEIILQAKDEDSKDPYL